MSNDVTTPRLDGVEQLLVTYPEVVTGGFSVVRRDAVTRLPIRARRR